MKREILTQLSYADVTEKKDEAPLPIRALIEKLSDAYIDLPAKVKNHKEILVDFHNRDGEIVIYYLRELRPGEEPDPARPMSPDEPNAVRTLDDKPPEEATPRPRPYMRNFDPEFKRDPINIS